MNFSIVYHQINPDWIHAILNHPTKCLFYFLPFSVSKNSLNFPWILFWFSMPVSLSPNTATYKTNTFYTTLLVTSIDISKFISNWPFSICPFFYIYSGFKLIAGKWLHFYLHIFWADFFVLGPLHMDTMTADERKVTSNIFRIKKLYSPLCPA